MNQDLMEQITSGLRLKCGNCGKGSLFKSYLKLRERCEECHQDLQVSDTADGPPFFVGFGVTILVVPVILAFVLFFESLEAKIIASIVGLAICLLLCLLLLPPIKAVLLNLQIFYDSGEGALEK